MHESELVDGEEYSGFWTLNGEPHRGFYKSATPPFTNAAGKRVVPIWEHQSSGGLHCALDTLRRVTPEPAPVGAEGKLHQHGCVFCGRITGEIRSYDSRVHGVTRYCVPCGGMEDAPYYLSKEFDAEITRRKQLASGSVGSVDAAHRETAVATPPGEAVWPSTQPAEPERPIERCACGNIARHPDPHMGYGDVPLEFCGDCYAAEMKRLHYEERCAAYANQSHKEEHGGNTSASPGGTIAAYQGIRGAQLDRAIARAKKPDEPAYTNRNWPEQFRSASYED